MKKILMAAALGGVLLFGGLAFAHMWGGGWQGGNGPGVCGGQQACAGQGFSGGGSACGKGSGYGGCSGPASCYNQDPEAQKKYEQQYNALMDETSQLRAEFSKKNFEYAEAVRKDDEKTAAELEKELEKLQKELKEKFSTITPSSGGYGGCRGPYSR